MDKDFQIKVQRYMLPSWNQDAWVKQYTATIHKMEVIRSMFTDPINMTLLELIVNL